MIMRPALCRYIPKYLIVALAMSTPALAGGYVGGDVSYAIEPDSTSVGVFAGYNVEVVDKLRVGPQVGLNLIDEGKFLEGPLAYQGEAALVAEYGSKISVYLEGGWQYTHYDEFNDDSMYAAAGAKYNFSNAYLFGDYKLSGNGFDNEVISIGIGIVF